MKPVGSARLYASNLLTKLGKVGSENGGGYVKHNELPCPVGSLSFGMNGAKTVEIWNL
jgi:hypothetical protein